MHVETFLVFYTRVQSANAFSEKVWFLLRGIFNTIKIAFEKLYIFKQINPNRKKKPNKNKN